MIIYLFLGIIFSIFLVEYKSKSSVIIISFLLLIIYSLRGYTVGTDYIKYFDIYTVLSFPPLSELLSIKSLILNIGLNKSTEIGWSLFNQMGQRLGLPFYFLSIIIILFILLLIKQTAKKHSPSEYLTLFFFFSLGFYFMSFNVIRHSIAIVIFLYSTKFIVSKQPIHYLLFCILAILFHTSAIILPFFYFINKININPTFGTLLLIISIIIPFLQIDKFIISHILDSTYFSIYSVYDTRGEGGFAALNALGTIITLTYVFAHNLIFIYCHSLLKNKNAVFVNLWFIGLIIYNLTILYPWLFRLSFYFTISQIIVLPIVIDFASKHISQNKKYITYSFVAIYVFITFSYILINNRDGIIPYSTIF